MRTERVAMQMVAKSGNGEMIFSTTCPPFNIESGKCIALKSWINSVQNLELHGKFSILVPKKPDCSMYDFRFDLVDNKFEELTLATFNDIKESYCIRILAIFAFKQSLILPSSTIPVVEINNMFLEIKG